ADQAEDEGEEEADPSQPEEPTPQAGHVDLQPGQEQQEGEAHQGQDLDGQVDLDPPEARRPDGHPGDDLEDDGGYPRPGEHADEEGRDEGDGGDDQQTA